MLGNDMIPQRLGRAPVFNTTDVVVVLGKRTQKFRYQ